MKTSNLVALTSSLLLSGMEKGDGQLESSKSPALPNNDKERKSKSAAPSKSVHDGPDSVFTRENYGLDHSRISYENW